MTETTRTADLNKDPITALAEAGQDGVLAIIIRVDGPSYRPLGAMMAFTGDGKRVGTLSSGCIESDLALHAAQTLKTGMPRQVIYGRGSPFIDIQLPCGGGLEILLVPRPDPVVLNKLTEKRRARVPVTIEIVLETGVITLADTGESTGDRSVFRTTLEPDVFFYIFGKGPEAATFAALVQSAGYPNLLLSPDKETLEIGRAMGCPVRHMKKPSVPASVQPDPRSAVVLFFHDHEWEPPILTSALGSPAFYVGAQGSRRARDARLAELLAGGVSQKDIARLKGPIGLIPSARDARTLAVSVLAEVLAEASRT